MCWIDTFKEKLKLSYIQNFKIYNIILNIIIIILGNISTNPQITNVEFAGFWPCDWKLISSIKEFSIKLYDSIFTNIIQDLPKVNTDAVYPIKGSPDAFDLATVAKLEEPEDLPALVENLLNDMNRRIRIYTSITGSPIDRQALQGIIYYTLDGNATDNIYWQAYQNVSPELKVQVHAEIKLIMTNSLSKITQQRELTPLEITFYQEALKALSTAPNST